MFYDMFNTSLETYHVPASFNSSTIIHFPKNTCTTELNDSRPVPPLMDTNPLLEPCMVLRVNRYGDDAVNTSAPGLPRTRLPACPLVFVYQVSLCQDRSCGPCWRLFHVFPCSPYNSLFLMFLCGFRMWSMNYFSILPVLFVSFCFGAILKSIIFCWISAFGSTCLHNHPRTRRCAPGAG